MNFFGGLPDLFYLGFYCPKNNGYFNEYSHINSHTILELKNKKHDAINFFFQKFRSFLSDEDIVIATVPSSSSANPYSGIRELAKQLVNSYSKFSDGVFCLERFKDSIRDNRTVENHLQSIKATNSSIIKDKKVVLIDDVLTTGASAQACKRILLEAGAKEIKVIVLGKTIRNIEDAHYFIDQEEDEYLQKTMDEIELEYDLEIQSYEMQKYFLKEEAIHKYLAIDEQANEQHSYFEPDDDDAHDYIGEEAQKQREIIDERYDKLLLDVSMEEDNRNSCFEHEMWAAPQQCQDYINQAHQVLDGSTCFSVDNPFVLYFKDW